MYVKGRHNVTSHVKTIHNITTEYANEHGVSPQKVIDLFTSDVIRVTQAGGRIVAHNANFDKTVINNVLKTCICHPEFSWEASFCTMRDKRIINYCALPKENGRGFKYPTLSELYFRAHNTQTTHQLHNALGDIRTLRDAFSVLLRDHIISFPPPRTEQQFSYTPYSNSNIVL